ncbi:Solute carrier family 22 member 13 [Liparis tanakae]|uniref:Solute carrier family 22 member 13 n=1 Tax=Liparis tanakae TaxID=230148 RepID=A0A4Z2GTQ3_9TELE|nr:Solute carrier family 22 member 13 [Liparis tanakae]
MADFGAILKSTGEFGSFQKITLLALCIPNIILPFHFASVFFIQSDPERHCDTDWILLADSNLTTGEQLNLTLPREEDGAFSRCRMFVPVDWDIGAIREYGLNETTGCRDGWVYYDTLYDATIVTDYDLVCEQANLLEVAQAVLMAGILFGCLLFGPFAESFGRKRAAQISVMLMVIFSLTSGLSPNFYLYLASQFMAGIGLGGFRLNAVILATEWIGPSKRSWGACVAQLFGAGGNAVLAGVIYFIRDWRLAQMITAAQFAVVAIYIWKYFFTLILAWFSLNLTYYCLSFNVGNLGLDIFLTQLMFGLTELPAHVLCIWLLEAVGRKVSLIATLLIGGFLCVLILAVPQGRFFINWAGSICNVYVQELFPTSFRQTASGLGSIASRAGGLLAPLLNILAVYHWSIPTIVFSSLTLTSGALSFLLPETRRRELPDSTREAEGNR